jgi:periplasmic protein TonB
VRVSYRHSPVLPWNTHDADERRFYTITGVVLIIAFLLGTIIPMISLPEKERFKRQTLPPRLARLILEQKQIPPPKPKPKPVKKLVEEKPKPKPEEKKPEVKKKPEPVKKPEPRVAKKPPPSSTESARKKAASSGLLAFADQLADLREEQAVPTVGSIHKLSQKGETASSASRSIITSGVTSGSGGINTAALSRDTGGQGLGSRATTRVQSSAAEAKRAANARSSSGGKGKNHKGNRTREEIQTVFDQNKGAVYALYNRALRSDPTLRGKVVLELTISPDGRVTACRIISSELNDSTLEQKLVSRIKLFRFATKDVETTVVSYPIDFLPS